MPSDLMSSFPAVLVGGPPHSGKSVLVYSLTQALRQATVPHYVLRACPDGEGDWANEAQQTLVRQIRIKGEFSPAYVETAVGYLRRRHLPLLVDVGGRPKPWQEVIFSECTHAILLIADRTDEPAAYERDLSTWQALMTRQGVPVIATLRSNLQGQNQVLAEQPQLIGSIAGLERGATAAGPTFDALLARLADLFAYTETELANLHIKQAPVELTLDLSALARTFQVDPNEWLPQQLPALLDYLPAGRPLALYGRSPNWLYAALALLAYPEASWLFDARLGWVEPPILPITNQPSATPQTGWATDVRFQADHVWLEMQTSAQLLDIESPDALPLPALPQQPGLVLSGKVPHWLMMAAARQFALHYAWTAVYQPQSGAIVIYSQDSLVPVGKVLEAVAQAPGRRFHQ